MLGHGWYLWRWQLKLLDRKRAAALALEPAVQESDSDLWRSDLAVAVLVVAVVRSSGPYDFAFARFAVADFVVACSLLAVVAEQPAS